MKGFPLIFQSWNFDHCSSHIYYPAESEQQSLTASRLGMVVYCLCQNQNKFSMLLFTPLQVVNVTTLRDAQKCCFRSISRRSPRDFCAKRTEITSRDSTCVNCNFSINNSFKKSSEILHCMSFRNIIVMQ